MATIVTKNSSTASAVPTTSDLVQGELAVNVTDKRLFTENASTQIVELGTNPSTVTTATATVTGTLTANGTFASSNAVITGGSVNSTPIGATTASTGNFSALSISGTAITATANELNLLDGVTATTAELNFIDGVTSSIQTQLNTKAPLASPTFTGTVTADGLSLGDNDKAQFGAGNDLQIYHDGSGSYIDDQGSGALYIRGSNQLFLQSSTGDNYLVATSGGAVNFRYNGNIRLATTATGIEVTGNASFADNGKATFGANNDLEIYHNGNNSFIEDKGTGNLYVRGSSNIFLQGTDGSEALATFQQNGFVKLYHDNSEKLATTSTGIDVTGTATMDGLTVDGAAAFASNNILVSIQDTNAGGSGGIQFKQSTGAEVGRISFNDGEDLRFFTGSAVTERLNIDGGTGDISFYEDTGTTPKFFWDASAESLGIGTSSPSQKLEVLDGSVSIRTASISQENPLYFMRYDSAQVADYVASIGMQAAAVDDWRGVITFNAKTSPVFNNATVAERMRIDASGNVGIGTDNPIESLHNAGNIRFGDTGPAELYTNSAELRLGVDRNNDNAASDITFYANNDEKMRIDASGNVGIGNLSPGRKLSVNSLGIQIAAVFESTSTNTSRISLVDANTTADSTVSVASSGDDLVLYAGGAEKMRIDASGHAIIPNGVTLGTATGIYNANNTLDDYEEGTFTPVIADAVTGGNEATASTAIGKYIKIGNLVTIAVDLINIDTTGLTTGVAIILRDIPFQAAPSPGGVNYTGSVLGGGTFNTAFTVFATIQDNLQYVRFQDAEASGVSNFLNIGNINSGATDIRFSLTYQTA